MTVSDRAWAVCLARVTVGLIFLMAGWWKVFDLGALQHARQLFVEPYAQFWMPAWLLWASGTSVPIVELVAGGLLIVGWRVRECLLALGAVLVLVTYGHLLKEPLYDLSGHVIPRLALILFVLWSPREQDAASLDSWLRRRR